MLAKGLAALIAGCLLGGAVFGFTVTSATSALILYGCVPMMVIYPSLIGYFSYRLKEEVEIQRHKWQQLSRIDGLTGLANRRAWEQVAAAVFDRYRRHGATASLIMIDIDHFKAVNDRFGHTTGDQVLCRIATGIGATLRQNDLAGRYGGEEFAVLLPDTDSSAALRAAERLRCQIAGFEADAEHSIRVSISLGIAEIGPGMTHCGDWIHCADGALYEAKRNGRNRSVLFRPGCCERPAGPGLSLTSHRPSEAGAT